MRDIKMGFELSILYSQFIVYDKEHNEFHNWTNDQTSQGFSYRDGCVAFGVPDVDGNAYVDVLMVDEHPPLTDSVLRAIKVPFHARSNVIVSTVMRDDVETNVPAGFYSLEVRLVDISLMPVQDEFLGLYIQLLFKKIAPLPLIDGSYPCEAFAILRKSDEVTADAVLSTKADLVVIPKP